MEGFRRAAGGNPGAENAVQARSSSVLASGRPDDEAGTEVDLVGCVFGVTVERSSSPSLSSTRQEVFASVDSIVNGDPAAGGCGGPRDGPSAKVVGPASPRAAAGFTTSTAASTAAPSDEFVIYRVYLTDESGACVLLEKRIRPELAHHHRILRSAPGACWAVVNAGRGDRNEMPSYSMLGIPPCNNDRGVGTVSWSSMTAVGGNGCAPPPRSIGGAPAGHLEQPLLALRRWVEGGDGRNAVRRERQRLALLLAREQRLGAAGASPSPSAVAGGGSTEEEGFVPPLSQGADSTVTAVASAIPAAAASLGVEGSDADFGVAKHRPTSGFLDGRGALLPTRPADHAVIGFVSSFAFLVAFPSPVVAAGGQQGCGGGGISTNDDDHSLWLNVDTGVHVVAVVLPEASLRMLLELTLDHNKDEPLAICGGSPTAESEDRGIEGSGGQMPTTKPRPNDTACDLLDHATVVLGQEDAVRREEGAGGVHHGEGTPGFSTPDAAGAVATATAAGLAVGEHVGAASPPPPQNDSMAVAKGRQHQRHPAPPAIPPESETAIDALVAAVCRISHRGQQHCYCPSSSSCGGVGAPSPGVDSMIAPSVAGSSALRTAPSLVTAGLRGERAGNVEKGLPLPSELKVGPEAGGEGDADDGTTSAEASPGPGNPSEARHCRAEAAIAESSGGGVGCVGRGGSRGVSLGVFLDDLAVACGGKQMAFSISRYFSFKLDREVGVVEGVRSMDVTRSTENLLNELADSHVPPS